MRSTKNDSDSTDIAMYSRKGISTFPFDELIEHKDRLKVIDVSRNQIQTIPASINNFVNIRELDLSSNRLAVLPDELLQLGHLKTLTCKNNLLNSDSLPKDFGKCPALESLNLSGNLFLDFPVQLTEVSTLRILHIGGNRIREVPPEIEKLAR